MQGKYMYVAPPGL